MERVIDEADLDACLAEVDYVLDVRTPAEYAEDHLPGALNVPVLTDAQRVEVGTLYKTNAFEARKVGAAYTAEAISRFLRTDLMRDLKKGQRLLVYCARGGQRSGSLSVVLSAIGFLVYRLKKGYKSYRRHVLQILSQPLPAPVYVLYGYTGSGKTRILESLHDCCNVLDLEGHAHHRGSLLGGIPGKPQPTQRAFETALMTAMRAFDPHRPTLLEGESRKVGELRVPGDIWQQMKSARKLWLEIPRAQRAAFILEDYRDLQDAALLREPLERLKRYLPGETATEIDAHLAAGHWPPIVTALLEHHYDPLYARPLKTDVRLPLTAADWRGGAAEVRRILCEGPPEAAPEPDGPERP